MITRPSRTIDDLVNLVSEPLNLIADMPDGAYSGNFHQFLLSEAR